MSKMRSITRSVVLSLMICALLAGMCPLNKADAAVRVGVLNFTNRSNNKVVSERMKEAADILAELLSASGSIEVIGRQRINESGNINDNAESIDAEKAIDAGRQAGCQYIVISAITKNESRIGQKMQHSGGLGILFGGGFKTTVESNMEYAITVSSRVIDVASGQIILSLSKEGVAFSSDTDTYVYKAEDIKKNMDKGEQKSKRMWTHAITSSSSQITDKIREKLTGEYATVESISGNSVIVNRGSRNGITSGDAFRVYAEGDEIFDLDGTSLGRDVTDLALLVVNEARSDSSSTQVAGGNIASIHQGYRVELVSLSEAEELIKKDSFKKDLQPASVLALPTSQSSPSLALPAVKSQGLENESTDPAKVIATYGLPSDQANMRRIMHINVKKIKEKKEAYNKYVELVESYAGDYLAAFYAAELAQSLKDAENAKKWLDKALAINPNYKPAQALKQKVK